MLPTKLLPFKDVIMLASGATKMGAFCLFFFSSYFSECKFVSVCPRVLQSFRTHFSLFMRLLTFAFLVVNY